MASATDPDWTLSIAGSPVDRVAARIQLVSLTPHGRESTPSLAFVVRGGPLPGTVDPYAGKLATLSYDEGAGDVLVFSGQITGGDYGWAGDLGWGRSYEVQGLRYMGDLVPHTDANSGTDVSPYNLDADDPEWIASRAGRTVGQILTDVLLMPGNAANLDALGIGDYDLTDPDAPVLPAATTDDLDLLTIIPPAPCYVQGEKLLNAVEGFLRTWAPNHTLHVEPDGTLRFLDQRKFGDASSATYPATIDLTMGSATDLVDVSGVRLGVDLSGCYQRVVARGGPEIEPMLLSLADGDLEEYFAHDGLSVADAKLAWTLADFEQPETAGSRDAGTCTCPSTTEVEVTSEDATRTWAANFWDQTTTGRKGYVLLSYSAGAGVTSHVTRRITANDALTAAGTATLTLDRALPHTNFDSYRITGQAGGGSIVWRRYRITDTDIRTRVQSRFPYPVPVVSANDNASTATSFGIVRILYSSDDNPPWFEQPIGFNLDRATGILDTEKPTVVPFGTRANLELGGDDTDGIPSDVQAFLPVAVGNMEAICPADSGGPQYDGTSHDDYGLERTLTVTVPGWRDPGNQGNMDSYACDLLDSVKDTVIEGVIPLLRFDSRFLFPGRAVNLAGSDFTTGFEAVAVPCVETTLRWQPGAGARYRTEVKVSTRRAAFSGSVFERPAAEGLQIGTTGELFLGGSFTGPGGSMGSAPFAATPVGLLPSAGTPSAGAPQGGTPGVGPNGTIY